MSRMNAGIILGAQQANPVSAFAQGQALRAQTDQMANQNALRNLYQTQGANIMAGDSNALNALAQFDPQQALAIQSRHQQMEQSRASHDQVMAQRAQAMKIQVEKYAQTLTKEQREAEAAQLEQGITRAIGLYQAGNLDGVNQILQSVGEQPLESLDQFPAIAALYGDALSTLKSVTELSEGPKPLSSPGKVQADINAGFLPEGTPLQSPSSVINNNVDPGGGSKLFETLDKKQGEMFSALIDQGMQAPTKIALVDEMERILSDQSTPEGFEAAFKYAAGQYGVKTEGLDALQSVQAIINRMVPAQRQPGSGPMSDADLALFKQSLPQLINTREGNLIIARTLRGIAQYEAAQGQIASAVANRELTPAEARQALAQLENPLQLFRQNASEPVSIGGVDAETQALIDQFAGD